MQYTSCYLLPATSFSFVLLPPLLSFFHAFHLSSFLCHTDIIYYQYTILHYCYVIHSFIHSQVNYQYRNGTTFPQALRAIYADGGIPRFYRGVLPALVQGPLSRFGDTAANTGILTLLDNLEATQEMNVGLKTVAASAAAATFRIFLMPIDTVKVSGEKIKCVA
jgi:hypothetical protein